MSAMRAEAIRDALKLAPDTELTRVEDVLRRAESHIADRVGPLVETEVVERVKGGMALILSTAPVIELTSVAPVNGTGTLNVAELLIEDGNVVRLDDRPFVAGKYKVTYTAGHAREGERLPGGLETAVIELCRHLWRGERGSSRRSGTQVDDSRPPGFLMPYAVESAIEPYTPVDGFA